MTDRIYEVLGICGSLRAKSHNMLALRAAGTLMPENLRLSLADISEIPNYNQDLFDTGIPACVERFREQVRKADALLFACPEYNFTMSGALKNAVDWASRPAPDTPLADKPAAIISATGGLLGGARVQYDVRRVLTGLHVNVLVQPEVFIGAARTKFDAEGRLVDETTSRFLGEQMAAFAVWIERYALFHASTVTR